MKLKIALIAIICAMFAMMGCAGLQIGTPEPEEIAYGVGQETAFWVLQNNLDYLDYVQDGLDQASAICTQEEVDLIEFAEDIITYSEKILKDEKVLGEIDVKDVRLILARLKLYVTATYVTPDDYDEVKGYICAFLDGVQKSVDALK